MMDLLDLLKTCKKLFFFFLFSPFQFKIRGLFFFMITILFCNCRYMVTDVYDSTLRDLLIQRPLAEDEIQFIMANILRGLMVQSNPMHPPPPPPPFHSLTSFCFLLSFLSLLFFCPCRD